VRLCYDISMSELALYRKYRPAKFSEVVGQDHVISVLQGALEQGNISHAYLFAGSRGTGKTSVARIFAQALGTSANDLYEIDAASSRGIDEIRELRDAVRTFPFESKYKVYIIDEVHMLTKEAFNALLKTLEEPPAHVIFILATTETHKLPETIVSRCQSFTFRKPTLDELRSVATKVVKKEGYTIEPNAVELVALLGDGSYRDTLGALQKAISASSDNKIVTKEIEKVVGAPRSGLVATFTTALLDKKTEDSLAVIKELVSDNQDLKLFLKLALRDLRLIMLAKFAPAVAKPMFVTLGENEEKRLVTLSNHVNFKDLPNILRELLVVYDQVGRSYLPELPLELALIKLGSGV